MFCRDKPQFAGVKAQAANISRGRGDYTAELFQEDFPQFFQMGTGAPLLPAAMLEEFVRQANAAVAPERWGESWRYAAGLYTAHYAALYLRTFSEQNTAPAQAAASGALVGVVKSAALGDSSVSYDTDALTKATENWGDLNATQYGQLLATRARLAGMGGTYVI